jgi:ankyrin repeat protein
MNIRRWLLVIAAGIVCLAGCWDPGVRLPPGQAEVTVPLARVDELLLARVRINGQDAGHFIVDTGASGIVVDAKLAQRLNLPWVWHVEGRGVNGTIQVPVRGIESLAFGAASMPGLWAGEVDFEGIGERLDVHPGGCLGQPVFSALPVTVDWRGGTLTFHDRGAFKPPAGASAFELRFDKGVPAVRGIVDGRHELWFDLDTGGSGAIVVSESMLRLHPGLIEMVEGGGSTFLGFGGSKPFRKGRVQSLEVLGHVFEAQEVDVPLSGENASPAAEEKAAPSERFAAIGADLLRQFRLTFDYQNDRLWAEWLGPESVAQMRTRGVDLGARDLAGRTLLHYAARDGDMERVRDLLDAGADIDVRTALGSTPLMLAANEGYREVVEFLLSRGADIAARNSGGETALMTAAYGGHTQVVKFLLGRGLAADAVNKAGETALHMAAFRGKDEAARALLDAGADIEARSREGVPPLLLAAQNGHLEVVQLLLARGANVDARHASGATALWFAAQKGHAIVLRTLLRAGADPNARMLGTGPALAAAAYFGHAEAVAALLVGGADARARGNDGLTALDYAVQRGHREAAEVLSGGRSAFLVDTGLRSPEDLRWFGLPPVAR